MLTNLLIIYQISKSSNFGIVGKFSYNNISLFNGVRNLLLHYLITPICCLSPQEQNNATIFQMIIHRVQKEYHITFVDTSSNKTMIAVPQYDGEGNEVECGVGDLRLYNTTQANKHGKHKPNFVLYDHSHKRYFNNNPECC